MSKTVPRCPRDEVESSQSDPLRSPRWHADEASNASSSSKYALPGASPSLEPRHPSTDADDAFSYQDLDSDATEPSQRGKILELLRPPSWAGDRLTDLDTERSYHALTSMALAFALYAGIEGAALPDLMLAALNEQQGLKGVERIDRGTLAVLDALGFKW